MVDLAIKNLLHDKLRFGITLSGVAFAVTLVFVQIGLFLGLLGNASTTIRHLDADLWVTSHNTPNVDFAHTFPESVVERVRSIPGVARADNLIVWFMYVNLPNGAQETVEVYAMKDFRRWNFPWHVAAGDVRDLRRGPYVFLDDSSKKRFGPFEVGDYREFVGRRLKIVGRTRDAISFTTTPIAFMDYRLVQSLAPDLLRGRTSYVVVKLAPGADRARVMREIRRRLPYNDVYTKAAWARRSTDYWIVNTGLGLNMYLTVFLGCLVGVVVVAQTLYTSTVEHLREFGTVKAIGGGNRDIYRIITKQAGIAALAGFAIGGALAYGVKGLMARAALNLHLSPYIALLVLIGTVLLCLGAALISFRKVASIDPALVFRT